MLSLGHSYLDVVEDHTLSNSEDEDEKREDKQLEEINEKLNKFQKVSKELSENKLPNFEEAQANLNTEIKLDLEIQVDAELQHNVEGVIEEVGNEKTSEQDIEIELDIQLQADSIFQQELRKKKIDELEEEQKNIDNNLEINLVDVQEQNDTKNANKPKKKQKVCKKSKKKVDRQVKKEIERLLKEMSQEERQTSKEIQTNLNEEAQVLLENQVKQEIVELQTKLEDINQGYDEELDKEIIEKIAKINPLSEKATFLKNLLVSFNEESVPIYEQLEHIRSSYFPTMPTLPQNCNDVLNIKTVRDNQQKTDEKVLEILDQVSQRSIGENTTQIVKNDSQLKKITDKQKDVNYSSKINKNTEQSCLQSVEINKTDTYMVNGTQKVQNRTEEKDRENVCKYFDIAIQLQEKTCPPIEDGSQQLIRENVHIDFNKEILKLFNTEIQKNIDQSLLNSNPKVVEEVAKEKMDVDLDGKLEIEVNNPYSLNKKVPDGNYKDIQMHLEFYQCMKQQDEKGLQKLFEDKSYSNCRLNVEMFKKELINMPEKVLNKFDVKIVDDFKLEIEDESEVEIEIESEVDIEIESGMEIEESDEESLGSSDIIVENGVNEIPINYENKILTESKKHIKNNCKEPQQELGNCSSQEIDEKLLHTNYPHFELGLADKLGLKEVNEVVEIVEDCDVKSTFSDASNSIDKVYLNLEDESNFKDKESFSSEEKSTSSEELFIVSEENNLLSTDINSTNDDSSDEESFNAKLRQNFNKKVLDQNYQGSEKDVQEKSDIKIQQEQNKKKLSHDYIEYQKKFYTNLKQEYDEEFTTEVNEQLGSLSSQVFDKQQQSFFALKDELNTMKGDYNDFHLQKWLKELQQGVDENVLLEMNEFPKKFDAESNFNTDNDIYDEFVELKNDFCELETEFKCNVPIETKEDSLSEVKPFNLFKKLHSIHKEKLCSFVNSKQWPENVSTIAKNNVKQNVCIK